MLALLLVAVSLGLSNFAGAVGIGVSGVDARTRLRVGVVFGLFEIGMPILGLLLGRSLARTLGHAAHWIGAVLLIAVGGYAVIQAVRERSADHRSADHHSADDRGAIAGRRPPAPGRPPGGCWSPGWPSVWTTWRSALPWAPTT